MKKAFKTLFTEQELRHLIREELRAVLSEEDRQIGGPEEDGFINIDQAAEFIKLKKTSIYQLVHRKTIPFHKSGKRVLFKKSELADWIKK